MFDTDFAGICSVMNFTKEVAKLETPNVSRLVKEQEFCVRADWRHGDPNTGTLHEARPRTRAARRLSRCSPSLPLRGSWYILTGDARYVVILSAAIKRHVGAQDAPAAMGQVGQDPPIAETAIAEYVLHSAHVEACHFLSF
ncbi:unnamed protein product [Prorocentrum cordatum]|uniref:Uncharacterized protein n=1 Tax=Prorocentrum cordatum TaxID=2364126 RepID=A0ABN9T2X5_9DINO|nr:unnamed protein product [Polarella glacialis]